jgi:hypothetical protein
MGFKAIKEIRYSIESSRDILSFYSQREKKRKEF